MKKYLCLLGVISICAGADAADFIDTAQVVSSVPVYERAAKRHRECWMEIIPADAPREHSVGGAVVGGVVGAVIGSQVGEGTGKKVATVAGGVAGAVAGDRAASPSPPQTREVERCREVETGGGTVETIKGYSVTYRYNGQDINTILPYQPGATIRIGVSVIDDRR